MNLEAPDFKHRTHRETYWTNLTERALTSPADSTSKTVQLASAALHGHTGASYRSTDQASTHNLSIDKTLTFRQTNNSRLEKDYTLVNSNIRFSPMAKNESSFQQQWVPSASSTTKDAPSQSTVAKSPLPVFGSTRVMSARSVTV